MESSRIQKKEMMCSELDPVEGLYVQMASAFPRALITSHVPFLPGVRKSHQ